MIVYDVDMSEACKYGTIEEFQFFDKVGANLPDTRWSNGMHV